MICFLHGAAGHYGDWSDIIDEIPSHTASSFNLYDIVDLSIDEAAQRINNSHESGGILIGYSMGGRLALHCLLADNSPWDKAIIISAHTGLSSIKDKEIRKKIDYEWSLLAESNFDLFLNNWDKQNVFSDSMPIYRDYTQLNIASQISTSFKNWSLSNQKYLNPFLPNIRIPVCWVVGEKDPKFVEIGKTATTLIPNSELIISQSSGHRVPWDDQKFTLNTIKRFIK